METDIIPEIFAPDAKARLELLIRNAERETLAHRGAVLETPKGSVGMGLARWHLSHAQERENALKEAWIVVTGRPW